MLETHIAMSSFIFHLVLLLVLCLTFFMDLTITHMLLVHERITLCLDGLVMGPHSHRGDHFPRRHGFPTRGSYTHFEPRHLDNPHFPHRGSHPTSSNGEVQKTVKTSSGRMVKCWIPNVYITDPSTEPSTSSRPM
jgi:hypothetical protein